MTYTSENALWQEVLRLAVDEALHGPLEASKLPVGDTVGKVWQRARDYILVPNADFAVVCQLAGLEPDAVREAMARQFAGHPVSEAGRPRYIVKAKPAKPKAERTRYTYKGETLTVPEWARRTGVPESRIRHRLNNCWTLEEALTAPKRERCTSGASPTLDHNVIKVPGQPAAIRFNGLTLTYREWSERTGIPAVTIHKRVKMGWTADRILTTPVRPKAAPGVASDFVQSQGTGGGTAAQAGPEMEFSK